MATGRRFCGLIGALLGLAACQPCPKCPDTPEPVATPEATLPPPEAGADFTLEPLAFSDLPKWGGIEPKAAIEAFSVTCASFSLRDPSDRISQFASYGGTIADWMPACSVLPKYQDIGEYRRFFEDYFSPYELITGEDINKLTGYYEPELNVSAVPTGKMTAPIPLRPDDLIEVKLGQFEDALNGKTIWGRVKDGKLVLYPAREDIRISSDRVLAFADPADVFFLQIQGSGRLKFPDGKVLRAGFDAHNHRSFGSLANHLIRTGEIERSEASMQGIRAWMAKAGPEKARAAMNINPRYVFFRESQITDPDQGPKGAAGLPLTPMGSVAVDLSLHPLGVPLFLDTLLPERRGDWRGKPTGVLLITQDTGGAIKGVKRGDVFFGWGEDAGSLAGRMNHEARFFVLLPQELTP